jgi:hypothetical protein
VSVVSRHAGHKFRVIAEIESILDLAPSCTPDLLWVYEPEIERALRRLRLAVENSRGLPARPGTASAFVDRELRNVPWGRPGGADQTLADELVTTKGAAP